MAINNVKNAEELCHYVTNIKQNVNINQNNSV